MDDHRRRWRTIRILVLLAVAVLLLKLLHFGVARAREPDQVRDNPEGLAIEFALDQAAILTLEDCISGRWNVTGETDGIRVNGEDWEARASGSFRICNRLQPALTLEVRLPSTAIAFYQLEITVVFGDGLHVLIGIALIFSGLYLTGITTWSHRALLMIVAGAHGGIVLLYQLGSDLSISHIHGWGGLHTLPMADLRHNLWETFLYLHSQPPLFSAYGIALDTLFGESWLGASYLLQVALGISMCLMAYAIVWQLTRHKSFTFFTALLLALNPAYFLYEALNLYTLHSAFFILSATFCLTLHQREPRNRYLYSFLLCLNLLILTRSVYHLAILGPALLLVYHLARQNIRRVMLVSLLLCLLSVGWYGKNLLVNGSLSSSSWLGMSLWKVARYDYDANELVALHKDGILNDKTVIWFFTFLKPSEYPGYGLVDNGVRILSGDNSNSAVYPEINQLYLDNALQLISHDPWRYFRGVLRAYGYFSCPSSTWEALKKNIAALPASHHALSVELFHMQGAAKQVARLFGMSWQDFGVCSNLYFIMPLLILALPCYLLIVCGPRWACWCRQIREQSVLVFIWSIVAYTVVVTSLLETPENVRYKFMIEIPLWIFIAIISFRLFQQLSNRWQRRSRRERSQLPNRQSK